MGQPRYWWPSKTPCSHEKAKKNYPYTRTCAGSITVGPPAVKCAECGEMVRYDKWVPAHWSENYRGRWIAGYWTWKKPTKESLSEQLEEARRALDRKDDEIEILRTQLDAALARKADYRERLNDANVWYMKLRDVIDNPKEPWKW